MFQVLFFIAMTIIWKRAATYKIRFYGGSQVDRKFYSPFLKELEKKLRTERLNMDTIEYADYWPLGNVEPDTVIVGHSLGGAVGLLQILCSKDRVKGCVLINSHFNHNCKMPYYPLPLDWIEPPTLVLLNDDDRQLPVDKAMDDFHVQTGLISGSQMGTIGSSAGLQKGFRKDFKVRAGTHYSTFTDAIQMTATAKEIVDFLHSLSRFTADGFGKAISTTNNSSLSEMNRVRGKWGLWDLSGLYAHLKLEQNSAQNLEQIITHGHISSFLASKPTTNISHYYPQGNLLKTRGISCAQIQAILNADLRDNLDQEWSPSQMRPIIFIETVFPFGGYFNGLVGSLMNRLLVIRTVFFPYTLARWLFTKPAIFPLPFTSVIMAELFVIPIRDDMVYYKLPDKITLLGILSSAIK